MTNPPHTVFQKPLCGIFVTSIHNSQASQPRILSQHLRENFQNINKTPNIYGKKWPQGQLSPLKIFGQSSVYLGMVLNSQFQILSYSTFQLCTSSKLDMHHLFFTVNPDCYKKETHLPQSGKNCCMLQFNSDKSIL